MVLRLDSYLAKKHPGFSRSVLQKFIKMGRVTVDGKVVLEPKQKVSESNEIILSSILNPLKLIYQFCMRMKT